MYRKSPATKEMRWLKLSRKGKKYDKNDITVGLHLWLTLRSLTDYHITLTITRFKPILAYFLCNHRDNLAMMYNPIIRGWINYYGSYCKTVLYQVFKYLDVVLSRWAKRKYKRIKRRQRRAIHWVKRIIIRQPDLFAHWRFIYAWARR